MRPALLLLMIGMNLLWAGSYSVFKFLAANLTSASIATLRFGLAALLLLVLWPCLPGKGPRGRDWIRVLLLGLLVFCLAPRLQIEGVHRGQAGDTSLLLALDPLITSIAAALFLQEQIPPRRWGGCAMGMLGVFLLSQVWREGIQPLRGLLANLLFISSFFCEAAYSVLGKPALQRVGALKLLGSGLLAGTVFNMALDLLTGTPTFSAASTLPTTAWLLLIYLALVCTVVGYGLWYVVIRQSEVNLTGMTVFVQPLAGLAISVVWLREALHWGQLWGSLVIVAGLVLAMRPQRLSRRPRSIGAAELSLRVSESLPEIE